MPSKSKRKPEENYDRICVSIPMELSTRLREAYPYIQFSSLITQLLIYADAANFMARLDEIVPEKKVAVAPKQRGAISPVVSPAATTEIEEFGA